MHYEHGQTPVFPKLADAHPECVAPAIGGGRSAALRRQNRRAETDGFCPATILSAEPPILSALSAFELLPLRQAHLDFRTAHRLSIYPD